MKKTTGMGKLGEEKVERARGYARLLRRANYRIRFIGSEVFERYGMTESQYLALLWISEHEGIIQADLVAELDSDPNTVSAVLRQLEKKKLIRRKRHPNDGRAISLFASRSGKEMVGVIRPQIDRLTGSMFEVLPHGHEKAIAEWLEKLAQIKNLPSPT